MTRLTTLADAGAVSERAALEIVRRLAGAHRERGVMHLALSGGSTPSRTYELLASEMPSWDGVEVWFADERCVGPRDEQSNYRLAYETLLGPAGIAPERVHRMEGELGPEEGAERYARALDEHVSFRDGDLPVLDVIVLGIGPDGHVASLFPGAPALNAGEHSLCLPVHKAPKPPPADHTEHGCAARGAVLRAAGHERRKV